MRGLLHKLKSDEALMLAYQHGNASAFEALYHRHKDGLFAFLYRSCPRQAVAEEIAQETWEAVINAAANYSASAAFRTWLYRIGRNRLADFWRRRDNRMESLDAAHEPAVEPEAFTDSLQRALMAAIGELPGEQRDALLLQEQGFSLGDIAQITGAPSETVKSRLRYARRQLREQLGEEL